MKDKLEELLKDPYTSDQHTSKSSYLWWYQVARGHISPEFGEMGESEETRERRIAMYLKQMRAVAFICFVAHGEGRKTAVWPANCAFHGKGYNVKRMSCED